MICDVLSVIIFPDCCGLNDVMRVETIQEKVQSALEEYCRTQKQLQVTVFLLVPLNTLVTSFSPNVLAYVQMQNALWARHDCASLFGLSTWSLSASIRPIWTKSGLMASQDLVIRSFNLILLLAWLQVLLIILLYFFLYSFSNFLFLFLPVKSFLRARKNGWCASVSGTHHYLLFLGLITKVLLSFSELLVRHCNPDNDAHLDASAFMCFF